MPSLDSIRRTVPLLFLLGASAPAAIADAGHALNYSLRHSLLRDDNLFRLPDSALPAAAGVASRSDTQSSTDLAATFDWSYGIQRLRASLSATTLRYRNNRQLDHDSHGESAAWLWRSGNRLDGELSWTRAASQSSFADLRVPVRNIVTTTSTVAAADYWFHGDWSAGLRASFRESANSASLQAISDSTADSGELSLRYRPASGNTVVLRRATTSGRYPNAETTAAGQISNDYRQNETAIEVRRHWSGDSELSASLGLVDRRHAQLAARDFRGVTGRAGWNWRASGSTGVVVSLQREIGAQNDTVASYTLTDSLSVGINWATSAKTSVSASLLESRRHFNGDPNAAIAGSAPQADRSRLLGLTASYAPLQQMSLSLSLHDERRVASVAGRDYRSRRAGINLAYTF